MSNTMGFRKVKTLNEMIVDDVPMGENQEPYGLRMTEGWRGILGKEWMTDGVIIRLSDRTYHLTEEMFKS